MNRSFLLGAAVGLALGLLVALFAYQIGRAGGVLRREGPVIAAPTAGGGAPEGAPAQQGEIPAELVQRIEVVRQHVASAPQDRAAWVELGNLYFDSHQPEASVEAYGRALALKPDDPDVLTDQGIMYRALRQPDRALANFQKAHQLQPTHLKSLFNQGVVYAFDLHDHARAEEVWKRLIQLAPESDDAKRAQAVLDELRAGK